MTQILRLPAVLQKTGLTEGTVYRKEKNGDFPRRIKIGARSVGWLLSDIENWIDEISGKKSDSVENEKIIVSNGKKYKLIEE